LVEEFGEIFGESKFAAVFLIRISLLTKEIFGEDVANLFFG